jgi:two-component system, NarL family, sensor kinase
LKNTILKYLLICILLLTAIASSYRLHAQPVDSITLAVDKIIKSHERSLKNQQAVKYRDDTARIHQYLTYALENQTKNYDSLRSFVQKALHLSMKLGDLPLISRSVQLYGRYFMMKENYADAVSSFLLSLKIEEYLNNTSRIADLNDELGGIYYYQEIFDKSLSYYTKALSVYLKERDTLNIAKVYSHLGNLHSSHEFCEPRTTSQKQEDFNTALQYLEKTANLCKLIGYKPLLINCYQNIASVYNKLDKPGIALQYLQQVTSYYRTTKNMNLLSGSLHTMGKTYYKLKQYDKSIASFNEALKISLEYQYTDGIQYVYEAMAQTYDAAKDYKNAYSCYIKYMTIRDSLLTIAKAREVFDLETKYQSEKKEKEIVKLTAEKREKNILLGTLSGLILLLALSAYFIVKNIRNKKLIAEQTIEIKEQYILDLEKERQLVATKSVLKGEESERSRMARDLHDGLGGLLSGVKINLSSMKGNSIITSENAQAFDHAIKLLDTSIAELRRVAHNLMPETLNHYGLKTALSDFIGEMSQNIKTNLSFGFFGEDIRFESQIELTAYRIAQELVNNALKHSDATRIDLQLITEPGRICIQVVDNGKGFDTSGKSGDGKGLVSIRDRVAANNGRFDIESTPGQGTEASAEFLVL